MDKALQNYASRRFDLLLRRMDILVRRMAKQHCPNASSCNAGIYRRWDAFWRGLGQECPSYVNRSIALSCFLG